MTAASLTCVFVTAFAEVDENGEMKRGGMKGGGREGGEGRGEERRRRRKKCSYKIMWLPGDKHPRCTQYSS